MRFCVSYSHSHKGFLEDFFLKSFPFERGVSLLIEQVPQKCASGSLFAEGWRDQMIEKQIFINKCLDTFEKGEVVVFSDVDIRFYGKVKSDIESFLLTKDICFMKDHNTDEHGRCGGFFAVKVSEKIRSFFKDVMSKLSSHVDSSVSFETSEQSTINRLLNERSEISWSYLPPRYYTHGLYVEGIENFSMEDQSGLWWENKSWEEKSRIYVPDDILVHHANWCHGIDNKTHLLGWVKEIVDLK
jgi:hypothetical protein